MKFYRAVTEWLLLPEAKRLACLVDDSALQSLPELTEELPFDAAPAAEGGAFYLSTGGEILNPDDAYISLQAAHAAALCAAVLRPGERYEILQRLGSTSIASQATTVWAAGVNAPTN